MKMKAVVARECFVSQAPMLSQCSPTHERYRIAPVYASPAALTRGACFTSTSIGISTVRAGRALPPTPCGRSDSARTSGYKAEVAASAPDLLA